MQEFYSTISLDAPDLTTKLEEWQFYYNWHRPHGALNGRAPIDRYSELSSKTPLSTDIEALYDSSRERIQEQNYHQDLMVRKLKRCL